MDNRVHGSTTGSGGGGVGSGICPPASNIAATASPTASAGMADHSVTVTVGGPSVMLHARSPSFTSRNVSNIGSGGGGPEINLNASAIVATTCCSPGGGNPLTVSTGPLTFGATKDIANSILARQLQETRNRSAAASSVSVTATSGTTAAAADADFNDEDANFDGLDLGSEGQDPVPLGEILESLDSQTSTQNIATMSGTTTEDKNLEASETPTGSTGSTAPATSDGSGNLIRLHAVSDSIETPTISATVNVATLDLSDPESIHQHLSQLNDTVLRVSTSNNHNSSNSNVADEETNVNNDKAMTDQEQVSTNNAPSNQNTPIAPSKAPNLAAASMASISISIPTPSSSTCISSSSTSSCSSSPIKMNPSPIIGAKKEGGEDNKSSNVSQPPPSTAGTEGGSTQSVATTITTTATAVTSRQPPKAKTASPATQRRSGGSGGSKASPQTCTVCSKVFSNASALAKHRLTHSEERRYHCNICGKAFKRQDHLNGHLLTHRSTKPFACQVEGCGKSYCDARSLRRHKENHHGGQPSTSSSSATGSGGKASTSGASAASSNKVGTSDNQSNQSNNSTDSSASTILSGPDHLFSKSSVLGDTKIKFSSKGLTAQQLQLIEQLFKESKAAKMSKEASGNGSGNAPVMAPKTLGQTPPPLNPTPVNPKKNENKPSVPDKPVECTICSRKFKNIPALNGHMRLHGGYYKKDNDGRRMVGGIMVNQNAAATSTTTTSNSKVTLASGVLSTKNNIQLASPIAPSASTSKMQVNTAAQAVVSTAASTNDLKRKASEPAIVTSVSGDIQQPPLKKIVTTTATLAAPQPQPPPPATFGPPPSTSASASPASHPPTPTTPGTQLPSGATILPSLAFSSLPQPDTSKLLANLEQKGLLKQATTLPASVASPSSSTVVATTSAAAASGNAVTSALRAMRKNTNNNGMNKAAKMAPDSNYISATPEQLTDDPPPPPTTIGKQPQQQPPPIASLIGTQPLNMPLVPLPTKPLPVQMATTNDANKMGAPPGSINISLDASAIPALHSMMTTNSTNPFLSQLSTDSSSATSAATPSTASTICGSEDPASCFQHHGGNFSHHSIHPMATSLERACSSSKSTSHLLRVDDSTDHTPKVGPEHQVTIPDFVGEFEEKPSTSELRRGSPQPVWHPDTANCISEADLSQYLMVASSCAVAGGSHNEEVALELLQKHGGNLTFALQDLLSSCDQSHLSNHEHHVDEDSLSLFSNPDVEDCLMEDEAEGEPRPATQPWHVYEVDSFYEGLVKYRKDFTKIARHVGTKTVKDCVEFYYLWKNVCHEESQSFKSLYGQVEPAPIAPEISVTGTAVVASIGGFDAAGGHHLNLNNCLDIPGAAAGGPPSSAVQVVTPNPITAPAQKQE